MTDYEILKYIDAGAVFYLDFFGGAEHMESADNGIYRVIRPRGNERGVKFVFDIRLDGLPDEEAQARIAEIKSFKMPVWWPLDITNNLYRMIHHKDRETKSPIPSDGDELYMATTSPKSLPDTPDTGEVIIRKVHDAASFALWSRWVKACFNDDYQHIHPQYHYPACESGKIRCYICHKNGCPAAVCSVMDNNGICSLEFVATHIDFRRQGLAKLICAHAIKEAFDNGANLITLRAGEPGTRELYTSLGFKIYNHALR